MYKKIADQDGLYDCFLVLTWQQNQAKAQNHTFALTLLFAAASEAASASRIVNSMSRSSAATASLPLLSVLPLLGTVLPLLLAALPTEVGGSGMVGLMMGSSS